MHAGRVHHEEDSRREVPGCTRHPHIFQHRRYTTISLEGHLTLLPLGKSRRARPDGAFRGRVGGGWGRKNRVRGRRPARMQPAGAPQARSGRGRRLRRELALGGDVGRGRVAAVEDRGRRADGHWFELAGYSHTPGILRLHVGQAPFTRSFFMTRKPTRRMRISPQPGHTVFSPGCPGTLPR